MRQGTNLKRNFQKDKIKALQMANPKKDPDKVEKAYRNTLASKEIFRRVPSARPYNSSGISMIKVPVDPTSDPKAPNTEFRSVVDPIEVEQLILQRNSNHFSQAKETPLASQRISDMLGFSGSTSVADQLLKGNVNVSAITNDKYGRAILSHCRRTNPEMHPEISIDEFKTSYKNGALALAHHRRVDI